MRFTSLIIELIRARPRLVVWVVVLVQAAIWLLLPLLLYGSPPGEVGIVLAIGREYQVGTVNGPPLAFWLADMAYRAAGNHIAGVYLLAQICFIVTFLTLYDLGRAIVGGPHAVLAVLLTMTVTVFGSPGVEFGPDILARPLWALVLINAWRLIGQGRRNAWFGLSIASGLLLLTTSAAPWLLALVIVFALATSAGRQRLRALDALYALSVIVVLALPYLLWLGRAYPLTWPLPPLARPQASVLAALRLLGMLALTTAAFVVLIVMNTRHFVPARADMPVIARAPVDRLRRKFVLLFALAPGLIGCALAGVGGWDRVAGGDGIALMFSGLAVVMLSGDLIALRRQRLLRKAWALAIAAPAAAAAFTVLLLPWIGGGESSVALPARDMAKFFGDSFERRTGRPLPAVAGDPQFAALVAMGASRPHLLLDAAPGKTPWMTPRAMIERGGVVVWRATDTIGTPPPGIAQRFPGLVAEIPRGFDRLVNGRQPPLRVGWGILRPK